MLCATSPARTADQVLDELKQMIGLAPVKDEVNNARLVMLGLRQ
jgi:hypothetical protein